MGYIPGVINRGIRLFGPTSLPGVDTEMLTVSPAGVIGHAAIPEGITDHGDLDGLGDDDHTQYLLLAGRTGGQTLLSTAVGDVPLTIKGFSGQTANIFNVKTSGDALLLGVSAAGILELKYKGALSSIHIGTSAGNASAAAASSSRNVFVGYQAGLINNNEDAVYVGNQVGTSATGRGNTLVGSGTGSVLTSGAFNTFLGYGANTSLNSASNSIAIGRASAVTASNQIVAGSTDGNITAIYFGNGVTNAAPVGYTINGTGGSGTNIIGGNVILAPGLSTGNATPASVIIQSTVAGASGTTAQTLSNLATFTGTSPNVLITAQAATHVPLRIKAAASQSGNLFEFVNSSDVQLLAVTSAGVIVGDTTNPKLTLTNAQGAKLSYANNSSVSCGTSISMQVDSTPAAAIDSNGFNLSRILSSGTAAESVASGNSFNNVLNHAGGSLALRGGQGTGSGVGGAITFRVAPAGGSGSSSNAYFDFLVFGQDKTATYGEAVNIVLGTTTGSQICTAVSQKLGFWAAAPVVQPASTSQAAVSLPAWDGDGTVDPTQVNANFAALETLINQLRSDLVTVGLIKGAA